ncbi:MAG: hypothetical protein ACHP7P_14195 [Terriglobales bacterium]
MIAAQLNGKTLALLLAGHTADGGDDWAVFSGTARYESGTLYLDRGNAKRPFEIQEEWLQRVRPVDGSVAETLAGAEYYLPLTVGPIPSGTALSDYLDTGLKWPA